MSTSYTTRAIVLSKQPYTHSAQFYIVYTQEYGKLKLLCRGALKITSKLSSHLEPLSIVDICFVRGRRHTQLIGSRQVGRLKNTFSDYVKLNYACYCIELVNTLLKYEDPDKALYQLLEQCLYLLEYAKGDYGIIAHSFGFLVLSLLGFSPEMKKCLSCNTDHLVSGYFNVKDGGVMCHDCSRLVHNPFSIRIEKEHIAMLDFIMSQHFSAFEDGYYEYGKVLPFLKHFISYYTEKKLKTGIFITL